jgi:hypothetical protein
MTVLGAHANPAGLDDPAVADELDALAGAVIGLGAPRQFLDRGHVRIDGLWSRHLAEALAAEARAVHRLAVYPGVRPVRTATGPGNRSPACQVPIGQAPLLAALHESLTRIARVVSARMVVPTVGTYGYYEHDDGCYLHVDTDEQDVTFLISVLGRLGPLRMRPELVGSTVAQLDALEDDPTWDHDGGEPISYPTLGVAAIRGRLLPHHRPASPISGLTAVGAIHYRAWF